MTGRSRASPHRILTSCCLIAFVSLPTSPSSAKGGGGRSEDRYEPQHIESLPPEVRKAVIQRCDAPKALHSFAGYKENLQKIVLHFEHLYCGTGREFCGPSGCLHQVYVSSGGHYRLLRSYYAPD